MDESTVKKLAFRERMKALKISELDTILEQLQALCGSRLQEVIVSKQDMALQFFSSALGVRWLIVDWNPKAPSLWVVDRVPFRLQKTKTPLLLFLKAHFNGASLKSITRDQKMGRVVHLEFEVDQILKMEIRLLPHGQNVILQSGDRSISLKKVQVLEAMEVTSQEVDGADYPGLLQQWIASRAPNTKSQGARAPERGKKIKKLKKSLGQLIETLDQLKGARWQLAGDRLVQSQSLEETLKQFPECIDNSMGLAENIQLCFERHKKNHKKIAGAEQRILELQEELGLLESQTDEEYEKQKPKARVGSKSPKTKSGGMRTRKKMIAEDLELLVGKSAADNLALLRRARAWDYWLHLQDFPSAHAILFRNRNREISDAEVYQAARFLVETHAEKNKNIQPGEAVAVIWTESRFVRPIKGDKMGRVTHKNTRSTVVKF